MSDISIRFRRSDVTPESSAVYSLSSARNNKAYDCINIKGTFYPVDHDDMSVILNAYASTYQGNGMISFPEMKGSIIDDYF